MIEPAAEKPRERFSPLRRIIPVLGILLAVGLVYDGAVFYSRWSGNRQAERARAAAEVAQDQKTIDLLGGDGLKIISFYAAPGTIHRGGHSSLCYGVTGAKTVIMTPAIAQMWPALSRCLDASPRKDTEYKLVAEDAQGHSVTQSLTVTVR